MCWAVNLLGRLNNCCKVERKRECKKNENKSENNIQFQGKS